MTESSKALKSLKQAANYAKLAMHDLGPRSYKKGQGALMKVVAKFGEGGSIDKKQLERQLGWRSGEVRQVAEKAQANGYVAINDDGFEFTVSLTDKGSEVLQKRFAIENHAADAILEALTPEEVEQLVALTDKISATCKDELGIDYARIEKKQRRCRVRRGDDGDGERDGRGDGRRGRDCECKRHGHHHGAPQYVFVFGDDGHGCGCKRHRR